MHPKVLFKHHGWKSSIYSDLPLLCDVCASQCSLKLRNPSQPQMICNHPQQSSKSLMQLSPFILLAGTFESWDLYCIFIDFFLFKHTAKKTCTMSPYLVLVSFISEPLPTLPPSSPFSPSCSLRLCVLTEFLLSIKSPSCSEIVERDEDNKRRRRR